LPGLQHDHFRHAHGIIMAGEVAIINNARQININRIILLLGNPVKRIFALPHGELGGY
jgi:hypothetical protein